MAKKGSRSSEADTAVEALLAVCESESRSEAERADALESIPQVVFGIRKPESRRRVAKVLKRLILSRRRNIRDKAIWCAYRLIDYAEPGLIKIPLTRVDVEGLVLQAKQRRMRPAARRRLTLYQQETRRRLKLSRRRGVTQA